jgi:NAD-dependent deacetylase
MTPARTRRARVADGLGAWASAHGQILFCESPWGGMLILLGLLPLTPRGATFSVIACAIATAVARIQRFPRPEWDRGLYGYSAALVGLFWGVLFSPTLSMLATLAVAATASPYLTRLAHRMLTPRGIPALALPALFPVAIAAPLLPYADSAASLHPGVELASWLLTLLGLACGSWMLVAAALVGASAGVLTSHAITGGIESGIIGNAVPTAIALGAVFLPWSAGAVVAAAIAAAAAGALWWEAAAWTSTLGQPALVWPFVVVTLLTLRLLRRPFARATLPGRPAPLPLASVGDPAVARAGHRARIDLLRMLEDAERVCVLTGAGVSTAAGLPDFRGPAGLWTRSSRVSLAEYLMSADHRAAYWREEESFYRRIAGARPTALHRALARLADAGRLTAVVTQNVDGLHQAAGLDPARVIEIHGNIHQAHCVDCGRAVPREALSVALAMDVTTLYCDACQGVIKGGSVMFGEPIPGDRLDASLRALLSADLLLVLGTSLAVAPAADMLRWAREAGIPVAIVNATATAYDKDAALAVTADVDATIADAVSTLLHRLARRPRDDEPRDDEGRREPGRVRVLRPKRRR